MYGHSSYSNGDGDGSHGESAREKCANRSVRKQPEHKVIKTLKTKSKLSHTHIKKSAKKLRKGHGFIWDAAKRIFGHTAQQVAADYFGFNPRKFYQNFAKHINKKYVNPWLEKNLGWKKVEKPKKRRKKGVTRQQPFTVPSAQLPAPKQPSRPQMSTPSAPKLLPMKAGQ